MDILILVAVLIAVVSFYLGMKFEHYLWSDTFKSKSRSTLMSYSDYKKLKEKERS